MAPFDQPAQYPEAAQAPYDNVPATEATAAQPYPNNPAASQPYATMQSFVSTPGAVPALATADGIHSGARAAGESRDGAAGATARHFRLRGNGGDEERAGVGAARALGVGIGPA